MSDEQATCLYCGKLPEGRPFVITASWADGGELGAVALLFCDRNHWREWHLVREVKAGGT